MAETRSKSTIMRKIRKTKQKHEIDICNPPQSSQGCSLTNFGKTEGYDCHRKATFRPNSQTHVPLPTKSEHHSTNESCFFPRQLTRHRPNQIQHKTKTKNYHKIFI
ncbi:hypothetical protein V8G54_018068 [Vigna mungo]|uniref:Uncharacterized protein n=1 Tax=Vigna mungo TaxID=3915 RepID=A0AAQ3N866_VIGMU